MSMQINIVHMGLKFVGVTLVLAVISTVLLLIYNNGANLSGVCLPPEKVKWYFKLCSYVGIALIVISILAWVFGIIIVLFGLISV